ncbi:hypothetical protein [Actinacidiphila acidipaludis]|uniref:Uncharacterized protein n=1 Tax=Actinacidiphila acidipaludis TaxID=2873382 RepID=A0ABS7QGA1_9ACTN|nr:hypothetical protein [Streptomyces acidipaludis]MBY8882201.1 hypothetical protein [Streptomyces acidipaludis]
MLLEVNDQVVFEGPRTDDWFVWGVHSARTPYAPGGLLTVVEVSAVKEMIGMVAQGYISGQQVAEALDTLALRVGPPEPEDAEGETEILGYDCPHGCPVCLGARAEFDAIATESFVHKMRLADPDRYPYAAGKTTLHRSVCPRVARYVGRAEPVGSPWCQAGLPAFAHHGVCSTTWAAGMQVLTADEAAEWVSWQTDPRHGGGYKLCCHCLSPLPGPPGLAADDQGGFDVTYWPADNAAAWG